MLKLLCIPAYLLVQKYQFQHWLPESYLHHWHHHLGEKKLAIIRTIVKANAKACSEYFLNEVQYCLMSKAGIQGTQLEVMQSVLASPASSQTIFETSHSLKINWLFFFFEKNIFEKKFRFIIILNLAKRSLWATVISQNCDLALHNTLTLRANPIPHHWSQWQLHPVVRMVTEDLGEVRVKICFPYFSIDLLCISFNLRQLWKR